MIGVIFFHGYTTNLTADHNEDRCTDGYTVGFHSICSEVVRDPESQNYTYGCPSKAWECGYHAGQESGGDGVFDSSSVCENSGNYDKCDAGFTKGWDSTCASALANPNAEHDIYGCPGISDKKINEILNSEHTPLTPAEKAACVRALSQP